MQRERERERESKEIIRGRDERRKSIDLKRRDERKRRGRTK